MLADTVTRRTIPAPPDSTVQNKIKSPQDMAKWYPNGSCWYCCGINHWVAECILGKQPQMIEIPIAQLNSDRAGESIGESDNKLIS